MPPFVHAARSPGWPESIEVRGRAVLGRAEADVVRDIAVRYLGDEEGRAYADRGHDDTLIRLEPGRLRAWDFADDV